MNRDWDRLRYWNRNGSKNWLRYRYRGRHWSRYRSSHWGRYGGRHRGRHRCGNWLGYSGGSRSGNLGGICYRLLLKSLELILEILTKG